jgi:membrane protease YdiL (CAAX protease family)
VKTGGLRWAIGGVGVAIAITTTFDAAGYSAFSALPLGVLLALFAWLQKLSRRSLGFTWGRPGDYALAVLYPVLAIGIVTCAAILAGATDLARIDLAKVAANVALVALSTSLIVIVTEEGFFRGWLWASLERAGLDGRRVILWSSLAFAAWHISAVTLDTGFDLPAKQIPLYLINATIMGIVWGALRGRSGSVLVPAVSHGLWNGLAYVLFGFGTRAGALGVSETAVWGPEVGILGLVVNATFAGVLGWWAPRR